MAFFNSFIFDTSKGETPESIARKRAIAAQIMGQMQPRSARNVGEGWGNALASIGQGITANVMNRRANAAESEGKASADDMFSRITSAISGGGPIEPATSYLGGVPVGNVERAPLDPISDRVAQAHGDDSGFDPRIRTGIVETANALGIDPVDLATTISYETAGTFDPTKLGPKTQWGQHKGFIQFGEPQAKQHGVDWARPIESQLGPNGAVASYLRNAGVQPGMGLLDVYSAVNAGAPGLYNRSDANNGGAPGTVRDKVEQQMAGHRAKAMALLGAGNETPSVSDVLMAYAPQQPQGGALASAPFASAGLPVAPVAEDVIVATTPEEVLAAEMATGMIPDPLSLPENQITMDYVEPQGGAYVDPVVVKANPNGIVDLGPGRPGEKRRGPDGQMYQYVETSSMAGASGGWGWIRVADDGRAGGLIGQVGPNDPGMWGMGMDPNNPATIPAMAGGTRDILPSGTPGQFPAAPIPRQAPQQPMQGQGAQGGGFLSIPPQMLLEALSNPFLGEEQKAFARGVLEMQMQAQDPYRQAQMAKMRREASGIGDPAKVQSSVVLDDGTSVLVMNNGERRVLSPTGEVVTGQDAADAIRAAREYTVQNQQDIYGGRRAGTLGADIEYGGTAAGAKKSGEKTMEAGFSAWEDYNKIQGSIANIDEAITALDNGAKAGIVYNMLPNVTEASASLKNAMDRMGLDVIGSVTFGALSEGEMRLAMDTAAPRDLGPKELRSWLARKRDAQEKAARMLSDAAMFLTVPGNTINDWIAQNRARKQGQTGPSSSSNGDGWQEHNGVRIRRKQ